MAACIIAALSVALLTAVPILLYQLRDRDKQIEKLMEESHEQELNAKYEKMVCERVCKAQGIKTPLEVYMLGAVDVSWRGVKED